MEAVRAWSADQVVRTDYRLQGMTHERCDFVDYGDRVVSSTAGSLRYSSMLFDVGSYTPAAVMDCMRIDEAHGSQSLRYSSMLFDGGSYTAAAVVDSSVDERCNDERASMTSSPSESLVASFEELLYTERTPSESTVASSEELIFLN